MYTTTPETIDQNDFDKKGGAWVKEGYAGEERKTEAAPAAVVADAAGRGV